MLMLGETKVTVQSRTLAKRLKALKSLTGDAKKAVEDFLKVDTKLQDLSVRAGTTEAARDALTDLLVDCDVARDSLLPELASALATAKLAPRISPFKPFSKHSPQALARLGFGEETKAIIDLCANIAKAKPPAAVKAIVKALLKENAKVSVVLDRLDAPTTAHDEAMFARNRFTTEWQKALSNLRVAMKSALAGKPGEYEALFAPE